MLLSSTLDSLISSFKYKQKEELQNSHKVLSFSLSLAPKVRVFFSLSRETYGYRTSGRNGRRTEGHVIFFFSSLLVLKLLAFERARVYLSQKGSRQAEGQRLKKRKKLEYPAAIRCTTSCLLGELKQTTAALLINGFAKK